MLDAWLNLHPEINRRRRLPPNVLQQRRQQFQQSNIQYQFGHVIDMNVPTPKWLQILEKRQQQLQQKDDKHVGISGNVAQDLGTEIANILAGLITASITGKLKVSDTGLRVKYATIPWSMWVYGAPWLLEKLQFDGSNTKDQGICLIYYPNSLFDWLISV